MGLRTPINRMVLYVVAVYFICCTAAPATAGESDKVSVTGKEKKEVIVKIAKEVVQKYIFPDTAEKIKAHLLLQLKNGAYNKINGAEEFARQVELDLRKVSKDKHFRMEFNPEAATELIRMNSRTPEEKKEAEEKLEAEEAKINHGFHTLKILPGNIGYLDLRFFGKYTYRGALETAVHAMNFLANADAVIIDLRKNGGGQPKVIQFLCSYFLEPGIHLNTLQYRYRNHNEALWTLPYVPGKRMTGTPLYILTSGWTFSGGEAFAYHLKHLKRTTLVGEKTRGGAHDQIRIPVADKYILQVGVGRAVNPVTGTNWEAKGVIPHINVPQKDALDKAQLMILNKKRGLETGKTELAVLDFAIGQIRARLIPAEVDEVILKKYAAEFYSWKIRFENGRFYMHRKGTDYNLIPISENLFSVEGIDHYQISFKLKPDGTPEMLILVWDDGFKSFLARSK